MKSDMKTGIGLFHEVPKDRSIIMGNITEKEIKKLVKLVRKDVGKKIEEEAIKYIGTNPIKFDMQVEDIEMGVNDSPSEKLNTLTDCYYICITIFGVRYCWQYCI